MKCAGDQAGYEGNAEIREDEAEEFPRIGAEGEIFNFAELNPSFGDNFGADKTHQAIALAGFTQNSFGNQNSIRAKNWDGFELEGFADLADEFLADGQNRDLKGLGIKPDLADNTDALTSILVDNLGAKELGTVTGCKGHRSRRCPTLLRSNLKHKGNDREVSTLSFGVILCRGMGSWMGRYNAVVFWTIGRR